SRPPPPPGRRPRSAGRASAPRVRARRASRVPSPSEARAQSGRAGATSHGSGTVEREAPAQGRPVGGERRAVAHPLHERLAGDEDDGTACREDIPADRLHVRIRVQGIVTSGVVTSNARVDGPTYQTLDEPSWRSSLTT